MTSFHCLTANRDNAGMALIRGLLVAGCALSLSGCYTAKDTTAAIPTDYRQRHPITIKESDHSIEVFVGSSRGGLTPFQRADILAFAQTWKRDSTGGIILDLPKGTSNELAAEEASHEIRSILGAAGIPLYAVNVRNYQPENRTAVATIKLNYPTIIAEAGPCGLWPADLGPTYETTHSDNKPFWNLGCATQRNLAAMVENPADLVQPRGESASYAARRNAVLDKYHKGTDTSTTYTKEDQGKITDIGK
jgi:pilus assembly protein CpaD